MKVTKKKKIKERRNVNYEARKMAEEMAKNADGGEFIVKNDDIKIVRET